MENVSYCESHSIAEREVEVSDQDQITHRKVKMELEMAKSVAINEEEDEMSLDVKAFEGKRIPPWREQITFRSMVVSFFLSFMFSIIVMKLNLTTGIIPSLNVSAGLLGFFFVKSWTKILEKFGHLHHVFTRQENTVIQTCVIAAYGIAFSGGFGSYLFATTSRTSKQSSDAKILQDIKDPHLGLMIGFLFFVSFIGLFSLVPLRKIMILYYKLSYPSDSATIHLISGSHTSQGGEVAKEQVKTMRKFFVRSFLWACYQWLFTAGKSCGFATFPTFGFQAYKNKFYFDFSATYIGVGMICPYLVNISALLGGILSWGVMWPLIKNKKGSWYSADLSDSDLHGLQDYKVFISIAMILGDGLYNFVKVLGRTVPASISHMQARKTSSSVLPVSEGKYCSAAVDAEGHQGVFLNDQISKRSALKEYAAVSFGTLQSAGHSPAHPALLALFMLGAWAGASQGGVLVGLAACGVMINIVSTASNLMQNFKTEYLSPAFQRSMFINQVIGTGMGCVIAPCVFWLFYNAFPDYYRNMTISSVSNFASLPAHCLTLCCVFFAAAVLVNLLRDIAGKTWAGCYAAITQVWITAFSCRVKTC